MTEKFSTNLKVLRTERGFTQEDVAREVGVVRQTIAYIEKGDYMPSLGLAWKISRLFNKRIDEVFRFEAGTDNKETL